MWLLYAYVGVCRSTCWHVCMCMQGHLQKPNVHVFLSMLHFTFWDLAFYLNLKFTNPIKSSGHQTPGADLFHFLPRLEMHSSYVGAGGPNSDISAGVASTLLTEPSPQPKCCGEILPPPLISYDYHQVKWWKFSYSRLQKVLFNTAFGAGSTKEGSPIFVIL